MRSWGSRAAAAAACARASLLRTAVGGLEKEVQRRSPTWARSPHSGKSVEGIVQRLEGRLTGLENTLKSKVAELERRLQETHKVLTDPHSVANSKFQTLVKLNQEHTEQLKRIEAGSASAASSGWLFPTLVCGQMLALAAFLFYRQVYDKKGTTSSNPAQKGCGESIL